MAHDGKPRFVVPLSRITVDADDIRKAFGRGAGAHKYIRREFYFSGGKLKWRYWYADGAKMAAGQKKHDPHDKHEHRVIAEEKHVHPHLAKQARKAIDSALGAIRKLFGWGEEKPKVEVKATEGWVRDYHEPFVEAEAHTGEGSRSPQARVHKALELVSDDIKEMIGESAGDGHVPINRFKLTTIPEDEYASQAAAEGRKIAGYASTRGEVVITDGAVTKPGGEVEAYFGSPMTLTEEVVIHEIGHQVHYAMEKFNKAAIAEWKKIYETDHQKVSPYAGKNWKEDFAEHFACAHAHPKQLAIECPKRYDWMREHLMPELPEREKIKGMPDEEFAWWSEKPRTVFTRLLDWHRSEEAMPRFHAYHSEKDQFYQVTKDGKVLYFRYGPPDKEAEAGWERMPDIIDPKTGLSRYEAGTFANFRTAAFLKEIYDEHGNALDNKQAFLYLAQFDKEWVDKLPEGEETTFEGYQEYLDDLRRKKKEDPHFLGKRIFDSLGGHQAKNIKGEQGKGTIEDERARHAKKIAKGKDPLDKRHTAGWIPNEIDEATFVQKSGTFKFGKVKRTALRDEDILRDNDGNALMTHDMATGEDVPVRARSIYEQENPDGTVMHLRVNEAQPFNAGETILAPQEVEETTTTGEKIRVKRPVPYTIRPSDDLDADKLATKFGITARKLLELNHKPGAYQLTDPIASALLNPGGRKEIRSAADLEGLMRLAAESDPPRRAWVSVRGGTTTGSEQSVAHIQVEWDGRGPPKVLGGYWRRRLGKSAEEGPLRIDELIDADDRIKLERVSDDTGRKRKKISELRPRDYVWMNDPKTGKRVQGRIIDNGIGTQDGKRVYEVQPLRAQGVGVARKPVTVSKVETLLPDDIPEKPGLVRRRPKPMAHDLLLYADEYPRGTGPLEGKGVIKIMLPKDGSITHEMLRRMPGVIEVDPDPDQGIGTYQISPKDVPKFRDRVGGFVMDPRVTAILDETMKAEREAMEAAADLEKIYTLDDFIDARGNINPDGPLKGLVEGDEGIQPGDWRVRALQKLANTGGRLYAAHHMGTGKTNLAIMADQMMKNLVTETGEPHPNRLQKRTLYMVPPNKPADWFNEMKQFAGETPTVLGSGKIPGALKIPTMPKRKEGEKDASYRKRVIEHWRATAESKPGYWNPFADKNRRVVIGHEYWRQHEETLRMLDEFDGLVIDEAHKVSGEKSVIGKAVRRWSRDMRFFLPMSGTPVKNRLDVIPNIMDMVTGGKVQLGDPQLFADTYLQGSAVMREQGKKSSVRTDLNPMMVGKLMSQVQPYFDVATTADVKGKIMPAVQVDENSPAFMDGQQARYYRLAMNKRTPDDIAGMAQVSALGLDERQLVSEEGRRAVQVARNVANCLAYKAADDRKTLTYKQRKLKKKKKGKTEVVTQNVEFRMPSYETMTGKGPQGWQGKWPTALDVAEKRVEPGYYEALQEYFEHLMGVPYEQVEGRKINAGLLSAVKKGGHVTETGLEWDSKVANPDYGPEGMRCRGLYDEKTKTVTSVPYTTYDDKGNLIKGEVPVGWSAVRDHRSPSEARYFLSDDWDYTGRFNETVEDGSAEGEGEEEVAESAAKKKAAGAREQQPKPGREAHNINTHPEMRQARDMFDAVLTTGNAKSVELRKRIQEIVHGKTGDPNPETAQMVHFGNRLGSSVRTIEATLRTMGYQDVNEALGHEGVSSETDKKRKPRSYFVTYLGKAGTLGKRDLNSEIFRRKQGPFGEDTGVSLFVHRSLYGGTGKPPKVGQVKEGWTREDRSDIASAFVDGKDSSKRLEAPMRVTSVERNGKVVQRYVYESSLTSGERKQVEKLEREILSTINKADIAKLEARMNGIFEKHWTDRKPLTDHQMYVMNNTRHMVSSDAAAVGMQWTAKYLFMYDSLFSPMDEAQRMARAARQLPAPVVAAARESYDKIGAWISDWEKKHVPDPTSHKHDPASAMTLVNEAIDAVLTPAELAKLSQLPGGAPDQIMEAMFASRALDRLQSKRAATKAMLRQTGFQPNPDEPRSKGNWVPPEQVTDTDVMSYLTRTELSPFERTIMRSRPYLVQVSRLTTSVEVPMMKTEKGAGGVKISVPVLGPTGEPIMQLESISEAEHSQLVQARAKATANEEFMHTVQTAQPQFTSFDFEAAHARSLGTWGTLDAARKREETAATEHEPTREGTKVKGPAKPQVAKAMPSFYIPRVRYTVH